MAKWYITPQVRALLDYIISAEAGHQGYNADYGNDDRWPLTTKTVREVLELSRKQTREQGERSSAIGGPQFLYGTLSELVDDLGLTGDELFNEGLQDDLAFHLLYVKRGLSDAWGGELSAEALANNIAKEWASMPVVSAIKGHRGITLRPGQSYYDGHAGNRALKPWSEFLTLVEAVVANPPNPTSLVPPGEPTNTIELPIDPDTPIAVTTGDKVVTFGALVIAIAIAVAKLLGYTP